MQTVPEVWKLAPRYPGYEASSHGRVRSVDQFYRYDSGEKSSSRLTKGRVRKAVDHHKGYLAFQDTSNGRRRWLKVHRIVADAFHGPANGMTVNHINCNKQDNRPENLEYMTIGDNVRHAYRHGFTHFRNKQACEHVA